MARAERRRMVRTLRRASLTAAAEPDETTLTIGPPARVLYGPDWPERTAALLATWNRRGAEIMAETAPERPWGFWLFDRPAADSRPGRTRDRHLAAGRMSQAEADLMGGYWSRLAFAQIAASRPGETTTDWLSDPRLIERAIEVCGWNPFTPDVIAYLRRTTAPPAEGQPARRATTTEDKETP